MNRAARPFVEFLYEQLSEPAEAANYINAMLADSDPALLVMALKDVALAHGMARVANETGLNRESLYKSLSNGGNPRLSTLNAIMRTLGLRLVVEVDSPIRGNVTVAEQNYQREKGTRRAKDECKTPLRVEKPKQPRAGTQAKRRD